MSRRVKPDGSPGAPHRQWNEILQEMRVMQTGIQILAAFLITLPFQNRFEQLTEQDVVFYVVLLVAASILIVAMLLPVLVHRYLFGQQLKATTVLLGHRVVRIVGICAGLLISACVWFVLQVLLGYPVALWIGGSLMVLALFLLLAVPRLLTPRSSMPRDYKHEE